MALWSCDNFTVHQVSGFYSARLRSVKPVEFIPVSPISHSVIYFFFFFFFKFFFILPAGVVAEAFVSTTEPWKCQRNQFFFRFCTKLQI